MKKTEDAEKVKNLWKMLDDMAENDPEAYERFVKKNAMAGGKRKTLRPTAGKSAQVKKRNGEKTNDKDDVLVKGMQKVLLKEPRRTIETKRSHVVLVLDVPEMDSMSDAELDISKTSVRFQSKQYRIDTPIPRDAISGTAKAKFSKRRNQLRIKFSRRRC